MNKEYFTEDGYLKPECLWQLRQEVGIPSYNAENYKNSFSIDPKMVRNFFLGWISYVSAIYEDFDYDDAYDLSAVYHHYEFQLYDNIQTLSDYQLSRKNKLSYTIYKIRIRLCNGDEKTIRLSISEDGDAAEKLRECISDGKVECESVLNNGLIAYSIIDQKMVDKYDNEMCNYDFT